MVKIKKGDLLTLKGNNETRNYFYTGIIDIMTWHGLPCVILATDLQNKNTFERFSQQKLAEFGYGI